jgi:hypothetical protein
MPACSPFTSRRTPLGRRKHRHSSIEMSSRDGASYLSGRSRWHLSYSLYFDAGFCAIAQRCALVTWSTKRIEPELCLPEKFVTLILCVACEYQESKNYGA